MIGYFPSPYNDEFIYSILSRFNLISSNESENVTSKELFSRPLKEIKMDLFPYAKSLEIKLKHFDFYNATEIIEKFSFFNYYNKFLCNDSKREFLNLMLDARSGRIKNELYGHNLEAYNGDYYKFCEECYEEDLKSGVPYWRIKHNLPGVTYCERHKCKLMESNVEFNGREFIALSSEVQRSDIPLLSNREERILKLISEQTYCLFDYKVDLSNYITPYISYLYELGYIEGGSINIKKLKENFMDFYSNNICEILNIDKELVISKVIERIYLFTKEIHPLFHILFLIFCNKKTENLGESNALLTPFNSVILNNTCICFKGIFIHNTTLRFRRNFIFGRYQCSSCGNIYEVDSLNNMISVSLGKNTTEKIMELLFIEDLSISEICDRLNLSKVELKKHLTNKV